MWGLAFALERVLASGLRRIDTHALSLNSNAVTHMPAVLAKEISLNLTRRWPERIDQCHALPTRGWSCEERAGAGTRSVVAGAEPRQSTAAHAPPSDQTTSNVTDGPAREETESTATPEHTVGKLHSWMTRHALRRPTTRYYHKIDPSRSVRCLL